MTRLLLSFYGDDFTGSTDVMESLTVGGVPTVLFVDPPSPGQLAKYPETRAVGIAGLSRTMSPQQMDAHLPEAFRALAALGAPAVHYKTCSTFDSSPTTGSIGHAIDLGQEQFGSPFVPVVVGAPVLGRYCVFGNLFARSGLDSPPFRLDRHPTMSQHPVTPMDEADLTRHLARQTEKSIHLFDVLRLDGSDETPRLALDEVIAAGPDIVLFDTLTNKHLQTIGRLIWRQVEEHSPVFLAGSSGVEYALTAHWQSVGSAPAPRAIRGAEAVGQTVVASGSCSPVTARQIDWALEHGFVEIRLDTVSLVDPSRANEEIDRATREVVAQLEDGRSVIFHTAKGPEDPRIAATQQRLAEGNENRQDALAGEDGKVALGGTLGAILRGVLRRTGLRRAAVTGGDSSGHVARALGIEALEMVTPLAPGSPLCRVHSADKTVDGMEITFKGGQVGKVHFFEQILRGRAE